MFRKLRLQLTGLCTVVTGIILTVLTLVCLNISESGMRSQENSSFQTNLITMYQNLQNQSALSHQWLRQMEYQYGVSLRIRDNGSLLFFQQFDQGEENTAMLDLIEETAKNEYAINMETSTAPKSYIYHEEFSVRSPENALASASIALLPRSGGTLSITVYHSLEDLSRRIHFQRWCFVAGDLAALLLFCIFFWFFLARTLRPLQENREKQIQFVASASHELRTPLTVMLSNVDAVRNKSLPADDQFLDTLTQEGLRMSRLISDMLQLASADNHSWSMKPTETEMDTLLLSVWESFEPLALSKKLDWKIRLPEEALPRCICDAQRIRQLLVILIDNAFSYTPAGGCVQLALEATSSSLNITVADNGPGIPDDQKAAVFERFYCIDASHKTKAHFGLGLCIAKEIVKLHKGHITLTDTPGGGATFRVSLPLNARGRY